MAQISIGPKSQRNFVGFGRGRGTAPRMTTPGRTNTFQTVYTPVTGGGATGGSQSAKGQSGMSDNEKQLLGHSIALWEEKSDKVSVDAALTVLRSSWPIIRDYLNNIKGPLADYLEVMNFDEPKTPQEVQIVENFHQLYTMCALGFRCVIGMDGSMRVLKSNDKVMTEMGELGNVINLSKVTDILHRKFVLRTGINDGQGARASAEGTPELRKELLVQIENIADEFYDKGFFTRRVTGGSKHLVLAGYFSSIYFSHRKINPNQKFEALPDVIMLRNAVNNSGDTELKQLVDAVFAGAISLIKATLAKGDTNTGKYIKHKTRAYTNDDLFNAVVFCWLLNKGSINGFEKVARNFKGKSKKSVESGDLMSRLIGTVKDATDRRMLENMARTKAVDLYSPAMKYSFASLHKMLLGIFGGYSLKAILPEITNGFNWSFLAEYCDLENRFGFLSPKSDEELKAEIRANSSRESENLLIKALSFGGVYTNTLQIQGNPIYFFVTGSSRGAKNDRVPDEFDYTSCSIVKFIQSSTRTRGGVTFTCVDGQPFMHQLAIFRPSRKHHGGSQGQDDVRRSPKPARGSQAGLKVSSSQGLGLATPAAFGDIKGKKVTGSLPRAGSSTFTGLTPSKVVLPSIGSSGGGAEAKRTGKILPPVYPSLNDAGELLPSAKGVLESRLESLGFRPLSPLIEDKSGKLTKEESEIGIDLEQFKMQADYQQQQEVTSDDLEKRWLFTAPSKQLSGPNIAHVDKVKTSLKKGQIGPKTRAIHRNAVVRAYSAYATQQMTQDQADYFNYHHSGDTGYVYVKDYEAFVKVNDDGSPVKMYTDLYIDELPDDETTNPLFLDAEQDDTEAFAVLEKVNLFNLEDGLDEMRPGTAYTERDPRIPDEIKEYALKIGRAEVGGLVDSSKDNLKKLQEITNQQFNMRSSFERSLGLKPIAPDDIDWMATSQFQDFDKAQLYSVLRDNMFKLGIMFLMDRQKRASKDSDSEI